MSMRGHLCIGKQYRIRLMDRKSDAVEESVIVLFRTADQFVTTGYTYMIRLSHFVLFFTKVLGVNQAETKKEKFL